MPERIITIKNSGPSKNNPEKYGWVLDTDEKFHNVTREMANAAIKGEAYKQIYHINNKGYEQTDAFTLVQSYAPPALAGHNHPPSNGNGQPQPHSYKDLDIASQAIAKVFGPIIISRECEGEITDRAMAEIMLRCENAAKIWWRSRNKAAPPPPPVEDIEDTF